MNFVNEKIKTLATKSFVQDANFDLFENILAGWSPHEIRQRDGVASFTWREEIEQRIKRFTG
jgi:hypothetical protein